MKDKILGIVPLEGLRDGRCHGVCSSASLVTVVAFSINGCTVSFASVGGTVASVGGTVASVGGTVAVSSFASGTVASVGEPQLLQ